MKRELQVFNNEEFGLQMRTILNPDGSISVNAEDTAIGFGWYKTEIKDGEEYTSIRWSRLNGYCRELGFCLPVEDGNGFRQQVGENDFIPEPLFYLLGMRANNERALKFQKWLAMDVIPQIRKTGTYSMERGAALSPQDYLKLIEVVATCEKERFLYVAGILNAMGVSPIASTFIVKHPNTPAQSEGEYHVQKFLVEIDVNGRPTNDVYAEYTTYCRDCGIMPISNMVFSKWVNKFLGTHVKQKKINNVPRRIFVR